MFTIQLPHAEAHSKLISARPRVSAHGKSLSGGQQQRLLLARALYRESAFLFLDEPTASLDDANTHHVHQLLRERKGKSTLIIASHKPSTLALADQVFAMENGRGPFALPAGGPL